ncbi:MAG: NAD(P)/FAD-dependent oxidoreductase [Bacteroidota bacterium]
MPTYDVLIVGAGLAGLGCARELHRHGVSCKVIEASDGVGGRVRTDEVDGFLLDRGFQVMLTAYPEAQRVLDYDALDFRSFYDGALVRFDGRFHRIADPLREPLAAPATVFAPVGTLGDKLRTLRLRQAVRAPDLDALWARAEITTGAALRERYGFSEKMTRRFFEPFLGGILLDPDLGTSSRAFEFYFRMFSEGETAVPARGMQQIPEQLAAGLEDHTVQLNTRVQHAGPGSVTLETGAEVEARAVVVATDGPELAYLLDGFDPPASRSVVCLYYAAPEAPTEDPVLVLDGEGGGPVNNVAVMSNVSPHYAPPGQHLVSVSVIGNPTQSDAEVEMGVRAHLSRWYRGAESWRHLKTYRILHAQPEQAPPTLSPPERPAKLSHGLYLAGDHRTNASINGALVSGRRAAEAVLADLGVPA